MPNLGFTFSSDGFNVFCLFALWKFIMNFYAAVAKEFPHAGACWNHFFHSNACVCSCPSTETATPLFGTAGKHLSQWIFHSVGSAAGKVNACDGSNVQQGVGDSRTHNLPCAEVKWNDRGRLFFLFFLFFKAEIGGFCGSWTHLFTEV